VWNKFIPILSGKLGLNIVQEDFKKVEFEWNDMDFSHHDPIREDRYRVQSFDDGIDIEGGFEVVRDIDVNNPGHNWTFYHQMLRLAHRCGIITNLTTDSNRRLVFNTDSMSVPVLPILANYCREILVIDVREGKKKYRFRDTIQKMNPDYLVNLFFDVSYVHDRKNLQIEK
jgi:hypothetical protein